MFVYLRIFNLLIICHPLIFSLFSCMPQFFFDVGHAGEESSFDQTKHWKGCSAFWIWICFTCKLSHVIRFPVLVHNKYKDWCYPIYRITWYCTDITAIFILFVTLPLKLKIRLLMPRQNHCPRLRLLSNMKNSGCLRNFNLFNHPVFEGVENGILLGSIVNYNIYYCIFSAVVCEVK